MNGQPDIGIREYRQIAEKDMSEAELQSNVVSLAQSLGWRVSYIPDWVFRQILFNMKKNPRKGKTWAPPGVPDLVMVRRGRLLFAELKSQTGNPRPPQRAWLDDLRECADATDDVITVRLWKPRDWISGAIESELRIEVRSIG